MVSQPAVRAGQDHGSHPSQPSQRAAEAETGGPEGGGEQLAGVEIYRVEVSCGCKLPHQGENYPQLGGGGRNERAEDEDCRAEEEEDKERSPPAEVGQCHQVGQQVGRDLCQDEEEEVEVDIAVEAGHCEVEAVVAEVGREPEISSQAQPDQQFPGERSPLLGRGRGQRLEETLRYRLLVCGGDPPQHLPRLLYFPSTEQPPRGERREERGDYSRTGYLADSGWVMRRRRMTGSPVR